MSREQLRLQIGIDDEHQVVLRVADGRPVDELILTPDQARAASGLLLQKAAQAERNATLVTKST